MSRQPTDVTAETGADRTCLLVTGASGYIGRRLVARAVAAGLDVVAAVREPEQLPSVPGVEVRRFELASRDGLDELLFGIDAVVHLAAEIASETRRSGDKGPNVGGARRLLEASRRRGVRRFLFLSSQSAAPDAATDYGRDKWAVEQLLTGEGEIVVRPGMVTGGPPRGVYGQLLRLCRRSTWLPILRPRAPVYPIHLDDLCEALLELVERHGTVPRRVKVAPAAPLAFSDYLRSISRLRLGLGLRLVPLPAWPIVAACRMAERLPLLPQPPCERVLGLIALRPMPPEPSSLDLDLEAPLRTMGKALFPEGLRRRLLREGAVLLRYVLGRPPPRGVLRRYVRAVTGDLDATPLDLPGPVARWPWLLRLFEPLRHDEPVPLRRRLALATRIAEMTPAAAPRFHNYRRRSRWIVLPAVGWILCSEALLLPARWILGRRPDRLPGGTRQGAGREV